MMRLLERMSVAAGMIAAFTVFPTPVPAKLPQSAPAPTAPASAPQPPPASTAGPGNAHALDADDLHGWLDGLLPYGL